MSETNKVSRRQFLNYTLTGLGGFMAAGMMAPMVRFAIDPVFKPSAAGEFISVADVEELTNEPQRFEWEVEQVDAWYESKIQKTAWVYRNEDDEIVALSPVCTHLGCTVDWASNEEYPNQFFCPCHAGRYSKDGVNIPGTPPTAPLPVFETKVEEGMLYLGQEIAR